MQNQVQLLFVYGSLRSGFHHPAYEYMARNFQLLGPAVVKGKLYDMGEYPVAKPTTEDQFIKGELYAVNENSDFGYVISQIDDYEGLHVEEGEKPLYSRELTTAFINDQLVTAWVYWFNENVDGLTQLATGDMLEYLQQKNKS
ncbi:MAG: gamma-glutamylcyclotransferase family protein [Ferruginibacter sp.]